MQEKIVILDFGSQTTQLIARRVRELNTYCEILPYNKFPELLFSCRRARNQCLCGERFQTDADNRVVTLYNSF